MLSSGVGSSVSLSLLLVVALLAVTVGALGCLVFVRRRARDDRRRLHDLVEAARRLAVGELSPSIDRDGPGDLGDLAGAIYDLASTLRGHLRAVETERERLAAVLTHMGDGVVIAGSAGDVRLFNPAAASLLELDAAGSGRAVTLARDPELIAVVRDALAGRAEESRPPLLELGPFGRRRAIQVLATRLPDDEDGKARVLLILQDVTRLRQSEGARRDLITNVSHELRTPIAALKALVETLEAGALDDPEVAAEFLSRMHVEVDGLAELLEELLELARVESGRLAIRLVRLDLGPVITAAVERLTPLATRQGLSLAASIAPDLPPVLADPGRMEQIVVNLVHNAVKFTAPGGRITVTLARAGDGVRLAVADTGVGISPDALERVFERFYKADRARSGGTGSGLGLAIAKHLVQAQGGRIWAESPGEGQGSTFIVTLPALHHPGAPAPRGGVPGSTRAR
ncbi:MAG TPA: ATP-binding protein [Thermomicrobiaceae bacterium]|nr:ATP-binding protein [Thermomicrobiaceae bacterium]